MVVLMLCYFIRTMDPTSSLGRICLGENIYGSSSEKVEGHGDWNVPEYTNTAGSKVKKVTKALSFYKMEMDEVSERYIASCFVNGLEAYDGEINLAFDENLISNEYAVKLCLDYEVKKGNMVVKKELIVALKREIYFVKFIINPKEDDVEPGVIFRRLFMRLVNGIVDFGSGVISVYPEHDPFEDDSEKTERSTDDWGKSSCNKKRAMENLNLFYLDIRTSSSTGRHLTQEEVAKEAMTLIISQKFALLEEVRPVLETMAYHGKYKKVLDEIWKDKVELDGMIVKEGRRRNKKVKQGVERKSTQEQLYFPIRLKGKCKKIIGRIGGITKNHALPNLRSCYEEEDKKGGINTPEILFSTFDGIFHQTFLATRSDVLRTAESDSDDEEEYEIKINKFEAPMYGPKPAAYLNYKDPAKRSLALQAVINPFWKISVWKKVVSFLGSLLVPLQHVDWKPDYKGCYTNKGEAKGQWRTEIRLTDPYGNIYMQAFTTKKTSWKLSKYHKLSDIMSPNWFIE
ncbi:hypothetical protein Tco_0824088 [Tanacetum coccineum]|uniref:Uncharacterized protein n=1 Tax=Tanacetum coccineum TaxID=301880 RepID=A0ABQ5APT1_9ASTR